MFYRLQIDRPIILIVWFVRGYQHNFKQKSFRLDRLLQNANMLPKLFFIKINGIRLLRGTNNEVVYANMFR